MSETQPIVFHRVLRANSLSVRRILAEVRRSFGARLADDVAGRLELALAEVLNNIVEHGNRTACDPGGAYAEATARTVRTRTIHLLVKCGPGGLACVITDDGVLLPGDCLSPRSLPSCECGLPEGGFGWYLIQDLVADLSYSREGNRNYLAFTIPQQGKGSAAA